MTSDRQFGTDTSLLSIQRGISQLQDNRQVVQVGGETLYSNDELVGPLQPYPGAWLPPSGDRTRFPVPDRVGAYVSRDEFEKLPKYMAQWVHWPSRTEMILEGGLTLYAKVYERPAAGVSAEPRMPQRCRLSRGNQPSHTGESCVCVFVL